MNLKEYIKLATSTESLIDSVDTNIPLFIRLLQINATVCSLLDLYKKEIFYKKQIDPVEHDGLTNKLYSLMDDDELIEIDELNIDTRVLHSILGCTTESGELIMALLDCIIEGKKLDYVNVAEEMADINWYQAIYHDTTGVDWNENLDTNIAKLKRRFPNKFNTEDAINRDLEAEREILEGKK